ncbi:MAG: hypothetical protein II473_02415 [Clostridia bacterium]|nr:hypothetical protein [Clostridia bacterium]MBQ1895814.1 hypothetical protein [Clostridia bacterium]MBQ2092023.1 hypothetical protein [Clostridia bacterium]MBQ3897653.1 hypothetical protein [Clostridia bacterium]
MNYLLIENLTVFIFAAAGFFYGAFRYLRPKKPLYASMIVMGVGCVMLARLFQCLYLLSGHLITVSFQIGVMGNSAAFAFFFASNFGQIDSLVDDGGPEFRKYRRIAAAAPISIVLLFVLIFLSPAVLRFKLSCLFPLFVISSASYFHLKHIFIPDVHYGVVNCLRPYNCLALLMAICRIAELTSMAWGSKTLVLLFGSLLSLCVFSIVPAMDRGVKRWTA